PSVPTGHFSVPRLVERDDPVTRPWVCGAQSGGRTVDVGGANMADEGTGTSSVDVEEHQQHHHQSPMDAARAVRAELAKLEAMLCGGHHPIEEASHALADGVRHVPAWLRQTSGERRWAVSAAVLVAVALQLLLPDTLALGPTWLMPVPELVLF